ncbi:hypothetical protein GPJ56_003690 [Histomonas meleagridis]|uniref:uncharacterized protein n=1 Tax=Histomonas meleagridis TaxID=135588 RepID=UPI0035599836|nr:hypothetical protein GPJ56_003690 [Histomonas meleagridis]KAH0806225.1 hypothetical protein GO595_000913 [Histomonas meleagridis]
MSAYLNKLFGWFSGDTPPPEKLSPIHTVSNFRIAKNHFDDPITLEINSNISRCDAAVQTIDSNSKFADVSIGEDVPIKKVSIEKNGRKIRPGKVDRIFTKKMKDKIEAEENETSASFLNSIQKTNTLSFGTSPTTPLDKQTTEAPKTSTQSFDFSNSNNLQFGMTKMGETNSNETPKPADEKSAFGSFNFGVGSSNSLSTSLQPPQTENATDKTETTADKVEDAAKPTTETKPNIGFGLGITPLTGSNDGNKETKDGSTLASFNFPTQNETKKETDVKPTTELGSFSFTPKATDTTTNDKSAASTESKTEETKPAKDKPAPQAEAKPSSFLSTNTPALSFGTNQPATDNKAPAFSFGTSQSATDSKAPALSFGTNQSATDSKAPALSTGSPQTTPDKASTSSLPSPPAFSFGSNQPAADNKALAFSMPKAPKPSTEPQPGSTFGGSSASTKPSESPLSSAVGTATEPATQTLFGSNSSTTNASTEAPAKTPTTDSQPTSVPQIATITTHPSNEQVATTEANNEKATEQTTAPNANANDKQEKVTNGWATGSGWGIPPQGDTNWGVGATTMSWSTSAASSSENSWKTSAQSPSSGWGSGASWGLPGWH